MLLLYLSKPQGTHGVFPSQRIPGEFDVVLLRPGQSYVTKYPDGDFVGVRNNAQDACDWADVCDGMRRG